MASKKNPAPNRTIKPRDGGRWFVVVAHEAAGKIKKNAKITKSMPLIKDIPTPSGKVLALLYELLKTHW